MKKTIFNNLVLKIISVFIAALIWLMVINGDDPEKTRTINNIKVTPTNEESFIEAGKVWDVRDGSNVVSVKIKARRSTLAKLTPEDITVVADLEDITFMNTIPLKAICSNTDVITDLVCDPPSMKISVEDIEEKTFMITVGTTGQPATGYEVGVEKVRRGDSVIIEGPASLLNIIDNVTATVDVSSIETSQTKETNLRIFDKNGTEFTESQMDRLIIKTTSGIVLPEAIVDVDVTLWEVQNITLELGDTIEPAPGYVVTDVSLTPSSINLAGVADTLKDLDGKLVLEDVVAISGITSSIERSIDLSEYISENYKKTLKVVTNAPDTVALKVQVEKIGTTTLNIPTSDLEIIDKPEDMDMTLTPADKIPIEVRPLSSGADIIRAADVKAELDLSSYQSEGNYTIQLKIDLPADYELVNNVTIVVNLAKKQNTIVEE